METKRKDLRKLRSENSRRKILQAAKELFLEYGYKDTTITMISKQAKLGYGTAYSHFPGGKEKILLSIMEEIMEEFYHVADVEYNVNSKEEAFPFTSQNIKNFLQLAIVHQEILAVFHEGIGQSKAIAEKWDEIMEGLIKRISCNVEKVKNKNLARDDNYDAEVVAGILTYTTERFMWKLALNKTHKDINTIAKNISKVYTYGLYS